MNNKKILVVGLYDFNTDNAAMLRVLSVVKALKHAGVNVSIHLSLGLNSNRQGVVPTDVVVVDERVGGFKSILKKIGFGYSLIYLDKVSEYDAIYCYGSELSWVICSKYLSVKYRKRLVFDVTEVYDTTDMWVSFAAFRSRIGGWIGLALVPFFAKHVFVVSSRLNDLYRRTLTNSSILLPFFNELKKARSEDPESGCFTIAYAGSPGGKDELGMIVRALNRVKSKQQVRLLIVGVARHQMSLKELTDVGESQCVTENGSEVLFFGRVPVERAREVVALSDATIVIRRPSLRINFGFPSKIAEAFRLGVPVIASNFSDVTSHVKHMHNGFIVSEISERAIAEVINSATELDKEEYARIKNQASATGENSFSEVGAIRILSRCFND